MANKRGSVFFAENSGHDELPEIEASIPKSRL